MDVQFTHNARTVGVHGFNADVKDLYDLFVGEPRCDPFINWVTPFSTVLIHRLLDILQLRNQGL